MKAIVFDKPGDEDVLQLKDVEKPKPTSKEVLVKVHVVGVNPVETHIRHGAMGSIACPHILGSDSAGVVEDMGNEVTKFKKGDRVWTFHRFYNGKGTYAEYVAVPDDHVFPLPDNTSFKDGAAMGIPFLTAAQALFIVAEAKPGETVLIHGASGGVGIPSIQFARAHGMTVIGTASTEEGLKLIKQCGAHHALNHKTKDYQKAVMDLTNGKGPDVILEMVASANLQKDAEMVAQKGRIAVIGSKGKAEFDPFLLLRKMSSIKGVGILWITLEEVMQHAARVSTGLEQGWLKPVVGKEYTLSQAAEAHREQMHGTAKGKIVLNVC